VKQILRGGVPRSRGNVSGLHTAAGLTHHCAASFLTSPPPPTETKGRPLKLRERSDDASMPLVLLDEGVVDVALQPQCDANPGTPVVQDNSGAEEGASAASSRRRSFFLKGVLSIMLFGMMLLPPSGAP